jgi:ferrous iron transport protein B
VTTIGKAQADFRDRLDAFLTHHVWGYVALAGVLLGFFWAVFGAGSFVEQKLLSALASVFERFSVYLTPESLSYTLARGVWDGFAGGAGILLPYLVPFLVGLAFLEDVGYLPRVAYLMDGLLHRIGLHGTSTVPLILGYGCSVPACLATRVLPSERDRFLATVLATLVPCSARSTVIFALVAFYLGPWWALGIFVFNALIVFFSGVLLARLWPEVSAGMVLEVPRYQWPSVKVISKKVWLRLREFIVVSWPLLVAGSFILSLADYLGWDRIINAGLAPLTSLLGLPEVVGMTLIFGVLRKELSMLMLVQALGTTDVNTVLTAAQIVVFTVFITFYIPCVATLASMIKEIGRKLTLAAVAYTFVLATALGVAARLLLGALRI